MTNNTHLELKRTKNEFPFCKIYFWLIMYALSLSLPPSPSRSLSLLLKPSPIVQRRQQRGLSVSWGIYISTFYCLRKGRGSGGGGGGGGEGVLADPWLWTPSGARAFMLEPILDLARVTPEAGGLMAHFAHRAARPCAGTTGGRRGRRKHTHTHIL